MGAKFYGRGCTKNGIFSGRTPKNTEHFGEAKFYGLECGFLGEGTQILQNIFGGGGAKLYGPEGTKNGTF